MTGVHNGTYPESDKFSHKKEKVKEVSRIVVIGASLNVRDLVFDSFGDKVEDLKHYEVVKYDNGKVSIEYTTKPLTK